MAAVKVQRMPPFAQKRVNAAHPILLQLYYRMFIKYLFVCFFFRMNLGFFYAAGDHNLPSDDTVRRGVLTLTMQ